MSWSLNAVVRNSAAGRAKLAERFATSNEYLKEPERSIKDKACGLVLLTLESMPDNTPVQVSASGITMRSIETILDGSGLCAEGWNVSRDGTGV